MAFTTTGLPSSSAAFANTSSIETAAVASGSVPSATVQLKLGVPAAGAAGAAATGSAAGAAGAAAGAVGSVAQARRRAIMEAPEKRGASRCAPACKGDQPAVDIHSSR